MQGLLQEREAECRHLAAQNIALQISNDKLHSEQILCLHLLLPDVLALPYIL